MAKYIKLNDGHIYEIAIEADGMYSVILATGEVIYVLKKFAVVADTIEELLGEE